MARYTVQNVQQRCDSGIKINNHVKVSETTQTAAYER